MPKWTPRLSVDGGLFLKHAGSWVRRRAFSRVASRVYARLGCRRQTVMRNPLIAPIAHRYSRTTMGLIDFVKDAGEKLFGRGQAQAAMAEVKADPNNEAKVQVANAAAGDAILDYIKAQNLAATGL